MKHRFSRRKRFILFFIGVFLAGLGVALSTRPGLGTSPISSLPYVVTFITPLTLGMTTVGINLFFMLSLNDGLSVGCLNLRKLIADNFVQNPVQLFDAVA